jgi:SAM-dependent methyltransferase
VAFDAEQYWNDRHAQTDGLAGVGYLGLRGLNDWMYRVRSRVLGRVLAPHAHRVRGGRVLDVGAGTGFALERLRAMSPRELVALDISEVACARLRERFLGLDVRSTNLATASDGEVGALGTFDAITAMDVLFHIVDDAAYQRTLERIARLLPPEGRFIFSENFLHGERGGNAWAQFRTLAEIERALSGAGLVLECRVPVFVLMNQPVDSTSRALKASWSAISRIARRSTAASHLLGVALFPVERILTRVVREGPSTEIAVAKRR